MVFPLHLFLCAHFKEEILSYCLDEGKEVINWHPNQEEYLQFIALNRLLLWCLLHKVRDEDFQCGSSWNLRENCRWGHNQQWICNTQLHHCNIYVHSKCIFLIYTWPSLNVRMYKIIRSISLSSAISNTQNILNKRNYQLYSWPVFYCWQFLCHK